MINVAAQIAPGTRTHTLCEAAQSKCMSTCHKSHQKSHFIQKITGKMPRPRTRTNTLCEPAQSKCMSTCHKRHQKGNLTREFTGKIPQTRVSIIHKLPSVAGKRMVWRGVSGLPPCLERDGEAAFYVDPAFESFSTKKPFPDTTLIAGGSVARCATDRQQAVPMFATSCGVACAYLGRST